MKLRIPKVRAPPEWGIEPVKQDYRYLGFIDYFVLWSSLGVGLLVLLAGSLLVPALSLYEAILVIVLGTAIGNLPLILAGWVGSEYAIPTMVTVRPSFGIRGSYIATFLNLIQLVGWTAFEVIIMAKAADTISLSIAGYSNITLWIVVFTMFCVALALGGPLIVVRVWLEKFAIWLVYGTSVWVAYHILSQRSLGEILAAEPQGGLPFLLAMDLVIAMPISWMPLAADYMRFSRDSKAAAAGTYTGYLIANTLFYFLGTLFVLGAGVSDPVQAIATVAFGIPALLFILVDETDNGFADIYSAAVSLQNILPKYSQKILIIMIGLAGMFTAILLPIEEYESFLLLIGSLFIPLFGVAVTDYFIVKKREYRIDELYKPSGIYWYRGGVNIKAVAAWMIGVLCYHYIVTYMSWLGASIPSLAVAAAIYWLSMLVGK
ncbi:MAG: putative hydroxymethylpyrimidine transporter CytX [Candidatus Bathyarchaeia archaeon]|nr:putative hydroxymethylpyrimidine transporter CytX [Candidatus Bathyarchaeota archaeon]